MQPYNDKKWNQKNMKECMKECDKRNSHLSRKLHTIYIYIYHFSHFSIMWTGSARDK